jgi:hypothetical protein
MPRLRRLAIMANVDNPSVVLDVREVQAAAHTAADPIQIRPIAYAVLTRKPDKKASIRRPA